MKKSKEERRKGERERKKKKKKEEMEMKLEGLDEWNGIHSMTTSTMPSI